MDDGVSLADRGRYWCRAGAGDHGLEYSLQLEVRPIICVNPKSQIKAPIPYSRYPPLHLTFSPDQSIYSPQREVSLPKASPVFQVKTIHDILLYTTLYNIYDLGPSIKPVSSPGLKCPLTPLSH